MCTCVCVCEKSGFLNTSTTDIFVCYKMFSGIHTCTHWICDNQNVSKHYQMSKGEQNYTLSPEPLLYMSIYLCIYFHTHQNLCFYICI